MIQQEMIEISEEDMKQLRELEDEKKAISQMMQMLQQQAEQKLQQYNEMSRRVWTQIQAKTGVNMDNTIWLPHPTENKIVVGQINFTPK